MRAVTETVETQSSTVSSEEVVSLESEERGRLKLLGPLLLLLLGGVTFTFGGVHPPFILPVQAFIFAMVFLALRASKSIRKERSKLLYSTLLISFCLFTYCLLQTVALSFCSQTHPVLGVQSCHPATAAVSRSLLFMASCVCLLFLCGACFVANKRFLRQSLFAIWTLGLCVTFVALAHWFYDSGKLFWMFAPEFVFPSSRARWPFVNANHLGHFLLLIFFFALGIFRISSNQFQHLLFSTPRFAEQPLLRILPRPRYLYPLIRLAFQVVLLTSVLLSIAATLSRSTWIGLLAGMLVLGALSLFHKNELPRPANPPKGLRAPGRRRRKKRKRSSQNPGFLSLKKRVASLLTLGVGLLFCFFLFSGQGIELIEGRIEFGLTSSKSDIRWTLYEDSLKLLSKAPLTGIGLSAWSTVYSSVLSPELANVIPEYLHSDPYQFLLEVGLLGCLPALVFFGFLTLKLLTSPPTQYACVLAHSIYAGIVGLFTASFFDFPFRIPAICYLLILMLALLTFLIDSKDNEAALGDQLQL